MARRLMIELCYCGERKDECTVKTIVETLDKNHPNQEVINRAADIIKQGGLVAFPTETVYGLGADGLQEQASRKIYEAKGRPSDNPLILHIATIESLQELAIDIPGSAYALAKAFWPGPLTMILKKSDKVPHGTTGGLDTVAIRMPKDEIALSLIRTSGCYIAAPSANTSGRPSPTMAKHVLEDMDGKIEMILDGGQVGIGIESTIVDLTSEHPMILRPGYVTEEMLERVLGPVGIDSAILAKNQDKNFKPKAPGMKYKHYAPKGDLTIFQGDIEKVVAHINAEARKKLSEGETVGVIATEETRERYTEGVVKTIGSRKDEDSIAHGLYAVLREFDELQVSTIYGESFEEDGFGQAIMNRLLKAAGYQIIRLEETD